MKNILAVLILLLSTLAVGQVAYNVSYHSNVVNPGGLNLEQSHNVWNVHMQHGPTNQWAFNIPVPIPFEFYGDPVSTFHVSQNGILTFGYATYILPGNNTNLPSTQLPDQSICAFWDSHSPNYSFGWLSSKTFGTFPNRQFWIRWSEWGLGPSGATPAFSIVLEETTNKVYVVDEFHGVNGLTATIGLQNNSTEFIQYGNASITPTSPSHYPFDNNYYEFTPIVAPDISPQYLSNNSYDFCGTNDSIPINVTITNKGLQTTSNIQIDAYLTGAATTILSTTYTGTLSMNTSASVFLGMVPVSTTGTVDVTVITTNQGDNNAQNDTLQETIIIDDLLESVATIQDETASGANDGAITLFIAQGTAPYTVLWSNGQTGTSIQNLSPGTYTATITDANGCQLVSSYTVSLLPDISPQSLSNTSYDLCGTNDSIPINVTIINTGGQTSYILIEAYLTGAVTMNLSKTYTNTLLMNVPTSVFLGNVPVSAIGTVDVTVVTSKQEDINTQNDTLQETIAIQYLIESIETIQDESISGANDGSITLALYQGTAPYTVLWSDGQTGATIQNLSPGTYTATITDANGCLLVESYQVLPGIMTSIQDLELSNKIDFRLYPNPAQRFVTIEIESTHNNDVLMELISIDGRVLVQYDQQTIQSNKLELDISQYPKGMYWVKVRMDGNETIRKLVIL